MDYTRILVDRRLYVFDERSFPDVHLEFVEKLQSEAFPEGNIYHSKVEAHTFPTPRPSHIRIELHFFDRD